MTTDITIRPATPDDAADLAEFHVRIWRQTYAGMAPQDAIDLLDEQHRMPFWQETLSPNTAESGAYIATDGTATRAVVSYGPTRSPMPLDRIEITHLYVCDTYRGRGLGRRMMHHVFDHVATGRGVSLAVVADNLAGRKFYASLGGVETDRFTDPGPLWKSDNIRVDWPA